MSHFQKFQKESVGCSLWKGLAKVFELFKVIMWFKLGPNSILKFWFDRWCCIKHLAQVFHNIFNRCTNKFRSVSDFCDNYKWPHRLVSSSAKEIVRG